MRKILVLSVLLLGMASCATHHSTQGAPSTAATSESPAQRDNKPAQATPAPATAPSGKSITNPKTRTVTIDTTLIQNGGAQSPNQNRN